VLHGPGVVKVLMSTPDDMVLNHLNLKSVEVATPSLRHWDLIGWDLDCYNREVSIGAIKHLGRAFWNDCSNVNFESLLVQFGLEIFNVWEPFCAWKKWKLKNLLLVRLRRNLFCHHHLLSLKSRFVRGDGGGVTRKRPERGDCSLESQVQAQLQTCRIKRSLAIQASIESVCRRLETWNKRIWVHPESGLAQFGVLFEDSRCQTLFLAKKEGWTFLILD